MSTRLSLDMERMVERQLRNWELARSQRPVGEPKPEIHDFVAISRQVGAGGSQIAADLGGQLGWPILDREILHAMADSNAVRERLYAEMDERDLNWLERALELAFVTDRHPTDYCSRLARTLLTITRKGHAIFVGRAADLVLPQNHGLRVRIVAPFSQRVRRYGEKHYLEEPLAQEAVARVDSERAEFIRRHFRRDTDDPMRFDLIINTGRLTIPAAVRLILTAVRERVPIPTPS